jgi:hypothetical protein
MHAFYSMAIVFSLFLSYAFLASFRPPIWALAPGADWIPILGHVLGSDLERCRSASQNMEYNYVVTQRVYLIS